MPDMIDVFNGIIAKSEAEQDINPIERAANDSRMDVITGYVLFDDETIIKSLPECLQRIAHIGQDYELTPREVSAAMQIAGDKVQKSLGLPRLEDE